MTNLRTITIVVSPDGETHVETTGFTGASCREASRALEQALGRPTDEQLTREYFQFTAAQEHQQQRQ